MSSRELGSLATAITVTSIVLIALCIAVIYAAVTQPRTGVQESDETEDAEETGESEEPKHVGERKEPFSPRSPSRL